MTPDILARLAVDKKDKVAGLEDLKYCIHSVEGY